MSIDALWQIDFAAGAGGDLDAGAGVLILDGGRVRGGDSAFYYVGDYKVENNVLEITVRLRRHAPGFESAVGRDDATLELRGRVDDSSISVTGKVVEEPAFIFVALLTRLEEL